MRLLTFALLIFSSVPTFAISPDAACVFDHKDYDSPGFSIPYRDGLYIKGHFGCEYICSCKGRAERVMHILDEVHKDRILTEGTGGAHRAKWNICPNSTKNWKPIMSTGEDALIYGAKVIAYAPDFDYDAHLVSDYQSPQINAWVAKECQ